MAGALGGVRKRALLLAAIPLLGAIGAFGLLQGASAAPRSPEDPAERMVLRLHDLPHGYFLPYFEGFSGGEFSCKPIRPFKSTPALTRFVRRFSPKGCWGIYLRAYRVPGTTSPPVVGTGALDAGSLEAGEAGFAVSGDILNALVEDERLQEVTPVATIGDATRLFHWKHVPRFFFRNGHLGSFLVWRSGQALAVVFASAGTLEASDRIVEQLAQRQQTHIESPTPYKRSERDTSEVFLDDPALTFPIYWLGRNFDPGHGLPVARLESGEAPPRPYALPRQKLHLRYSKDVYLNSWTRAGWKRFLATRASRIMRTWRCTESIELEIPGGHARVFAAQGRDFDVCPDRPPKLFFAFAYLHGTVTAVNFISCPHCGEVPYGPYNSLRGMKEVVRGLRLRPEPVYPAG